MDSLLQTMSSSPGNVGEQSGAHVLRLMELEPHRLVAAFATEERLAADLLACVDLVREEAGSGDELIARALSGVVSGGKRLRPLLALATAYATWIGTPGAERAADRDRAVRAGAAVELLHLASLVHDDVMDEAGVRHGVPTANVRDGNIRAVLAGDFLLARAVAVACGLGQREGMLVSETFARLCDGQARESALLFDAARTEPDYYDAITGKTAALLATACRLGALAAGAGTEAAEALTSYGHHLGLAYQLVDDLLDLTGSDERLRKPAGHDVAMGVFTLPVLYAQEEHPRLAGLLGALQPEDDGTVREVVDLVKDSSALRRTRAAVDEQTRYAVGALSGAAAGLTPAGLAMLSELVACLARRAH
ncbi:polyprenyl synthetase family protein [Actinomadura alba]|uniref:Polyprenyl synthetase family protein n=1 Tax=Actinomadura alba TaxID=406431 RepID=A0ABR7LU27_9ACTN|nr:polyprenyl synthetase family protein [Actinomadura alba]MBC6468347.1 polyprenyl synthetase family protein [Actinomadura alba]